MPARILVIEDNAANLDLMRLILTSYGHQLVGVANGLEGLEQAKNSAFDLIISDVLMPGIDGYELARRAKADPQLKDTPVVAVTALAMVGDKEKVLAAGFEGYIAKPIDPLTFAHDVDAFLPDDRKSVAPTPAQRAESKPLIEASGPVILAVDDTPENLELLASSLPSRGYQIVGVRSAAEGFDAARKLMPALILCDVKMPGRGGLDFLRDAKSDRQIAHIPVVMLWSSKVTAQHKERALQLGAAALLERPIDLHALSATIERCIEAAARGGGNALGKAPG